MDAAGRLYGTTYYGGAGGKGTVFELIPNAAKTKWTHTVLYSFSTGYCPDGCWPEAGLIVDRSRNLYGTTSYGGAYGAGTVFKLTPNAAQTKWTHTVLYSFCATGGLRCTDGAGTVFALP